MNTTVLAKPTTAPTDLTNLATAIAHGHPDEGLSLTLTPTQWAQVAPYLNLFTLASGQTLCCQGDRDRTVYFVETGNLSVHYEDEKGRIRLAIVGGGSVIGEGAFFSHRPRNASVQANSSCRLWSLSAIRFSELSHRHPELALVLTLALAGVMARRVPSRRRRVAVT